MKFKSMFLFRTLTSSWFIIGNWKLKPQICQYLVCEEELKEEVNGRRIKQWFFFPQGGVNFPIALCTFPKYYCCMKMFLCWKCGSDLVIFVPENTDRYVYLGWGGGERQREREMGEALFKFIQRFWDFYLQKKKNQTTGYVYEIFPLVANDHLTYLWSSFAIRKISAPTCVKRSHMSLLCPCP